jgi:hypothetical protein
MFWPVTSRPRRCAYSDESPIWIPENAEGMRLGPYSASSTMSDERRAVVVVVPWAE